MFALSGADGRGAVVMRRQLRRAQVLEFMRKLAPCVVGLEACGGAHHWARAIAKLGHEVRLLSPRAGPAVSHEPQQARPQRRRRDLQEAVGRPQYAPGRGQRAWPSRTCWRCIGCWYATAEAAHALENLLRALLHERGVIARLGAKGLRTAAG